MKYSYLFLALLFTCCTSRPPRNGDGVANELPSITTEDAIGIPEDSMHYIGFVESFSETNEYYIELFFNESFDYDNYSTLSDQGDSLIYNGNEITRNRIPFSKASLHIDLRGLGKLTVFNRDHEPVATACIKRIEYYEDMLGSEFVAILEIDKVESSDLVYCIGNYNGKPIPIRHAAIENDSLDSLVKNAVTINDDQYITTAHYRIEPYPNVYSTLSTDTTAYIFELSDAGPQILYKSPYSEDITDLTPVAIEVNNQPLLLIRAGTPESDVFWTSLLVFNGTEYEVQSRNRIAN